MQIYPDAGFRLLGLAEGHLLKRPVGKEIISVMPAVLEDDPFLGDAPCVKRQQEP
jgi:hypothetical protein